MSQRIHIRVLVVVSTLIVITSCIGLRWSGFFVPSVDDIVSAIITDRNGVMLREVLTPKGTRHRWVGLDDVSPHLIDATIIAEDKRFYRHPGVDILALVRAAVQDIRAGTIVSGGSTITQQLARMLNPKPRTITAKIREALHAFWLELMLPKDEILAHYLNRAPYGNQLIGCEAAAQMYFDKPARDLSIAEAAYLAVLPRAPSAINPYRRRDVLKGLQRRLIRRLCDAGRISNAAMEASLVQPVRPLPKRWAFAAPHFVELLHTERTTGTIRTSLDMHLQATVERIIDDQLEALEHRNVTNAAAVVVDNRTGDVLALAGSSDYFDDVSGGQVNGATARRQPGSTLKPFLYALALENGYTASSIIPDVEMSFPTSNGDYAPMNYDLTFRGPVRLRVALANSLNVPAVYLLSRIGVHTFISFLHELGFSSLDREPQHYGLGLTLGNGEVTLLELAAGYATIARGGMYLPLSFVLRDGATHGKRVFSPATAYLIADILSDDATRRMSFGEDTPLTLPFTTAAKTGTTKNFRDNWTVGFTRDYTVATWVGNFDGSPMKGVSGITGAGPIFRAVMLALSEIAQPEWPDLPEGIEVRRVCPLSGKHPSEHCATAIDELFVQGTAPEHTCPFHTERTIDLRNGLLASAACETRWTGRRSFIELPPCYHDWAATHNIPLPPHGYSPHCPPASALTAHAVAPRIEHPRDKAIYAIDRHMPRRLQALTLAARAEGSLTWLVNGKELVTTTPPHRASWSIEPGTHRIAIARQDKAVLDEIEITVHP